ncbi:MAG: DNA polymerase III subunit gamma/tau [Clostridia bacterium]|nr:DNA polymerase III subunit gamma/tau [Clostridia bacterium]
MAYQALYRQWRPSTFSEMVGQEGIMTALRNQVAGGRIAHAYLFCGTRGTGKTSTAKILSRAVNCLNPHDGDPCCECENCRRILEGESLDVMEIDAASNNGVDQVRELRDTVQYPPQFGTYKVYIIDEVHMLSVAAFNALLKTLEEPPEYVIFILATTEPQKLPATILSRCQRFDFGRIPAEKIAGRLREAAEKSGVEAEPEALSLIARAAEGGMRDALSILDMCIGYATHVDTQLVHEVLGTADRAFLFRFAEALKTHAIDQALLCIDEVVRAGSDPVVFSRDISAHMRALLLAQSCGDKIADILEITSEDARDYQTQCQDFPASALLRAMDIFMKVENAMKTISMPRLALESAAIRACLSSEEKDVDALAARVEELENQCRMLEKSVREGVSVKAASKAAPKTAAASAGAPERKAPVAQKVLDGDSQAVWKSLIDYLKKGSGASIVSMLAMGKLREVQGNKYIWEPNDSFDFYSDALNSERYRSMIANALTEITGTPTAFQAAKKGQEMPVNDGEESLLSELSETFGAMNVSVQEKKKV